MIMLTVWGLQGGWHLQRDQYLPCINNPCKPQVQIKKAATLVWTVDFLRQSPTLTNRTYTVFLSTSVISATSSTTLQPDCSMESFLNHQDRVWSFPSQCNTISEHFSRALQHKPQGVCGGGVTIYEALALLSHNFPLQSATRVSEGIQTAEKTRRSLLMLFVLF